MEPINAQPNFAVIEQHRSSEAATEKKKRRFNFSFGIGYTFNGRKADLFKLQIKKI